ncbi:MAG: hypothetical protein IJ899_02285 [Blautia sp.]|nr:hypothetical protein [Blautia sp.]
MDEHLQKWVRLIAEAESCGMTIRKWCKENGISKGSYYYWHKILRTEGLLPCQAGKITDEKNSGMTKEQKGVQIPDFFEMPLPNAVYGSPRVQNGCNCFETQIMVQRGQCQVYIGNDFSAETLARVLEVIA